MSLTSIKSKLSKLHEELVIAQADKASNNAFVLLSPFSHQRQSMRLAANKLENVLSFKRFMLRAEVLKLYREMLRTVRKVPSEDYRTQLKDWVRHDFRSNKHLADEEAIKMMITRGRMSLKEIKSTIDLSS